MLFNDGETILIKDGKVTSLSRDKVELIKKKRQRQSRRRHARKKYEEIIVTAKSVPCMDCKGEFPFFSMDFDHRPNEVKCFGIGSGYRASADRLIAEIAKCDVVCANCHRIRTWNRIQEAKDTNASNEKLISVDG
jgi:hypothetical protein